jgi:DNA-binding NarL/FixJ family response regulator
MRVIVVDDEYQVRSALRLLLEQEQNVEIVFDTDTLEGLLEQLQDICADLLLLDWDMRLPGLNNTVITNIRHRCPKMRILALSGRPESRVGALQAGVDAFVSKGDPPERLLQFLRQICNDPFLPIS